MVSKKLLVLSALALTLSVGLVGCSETTGDRDGGAGNKADSYSDATDVKVFKNADSVPNVAFFCLGDTGWASTLSGTDAGENKAATLVRNPDYDSTCTGVSEPK